MDKERRRKSAGKISLDLCTKKLHDVFIVGSLMLVRYFHFFYFLFASVAGIRYRYKCNLLDEIVLAYQTFKKKMVSKTFVHIGFYAVN